VVLVGPGAVAAGVAVAAVGPGTRGLGLGSPLALRCFFSSSSSLLRAPAVLVSLFVVTLAAMQVSIIDASTLSMKVSKNASNNASIDGYWS